jgi:phosphoglycerate kinase
MSCLSAAHDTMRPGDVRSDLNYQLPTLDDLEVEDRRVLLRADLNVPLEHEPHGTRVRVADDARIWAALTTIEELRRRQARIVLVSHLGRPVGRDPQLSMRPVADRVAELTGARVTLAPAVIGPEVKELSERVAPGEILVLENVRYEPGETHNDPALVSALAELADVYVNDAFGTAHRAHASTEGIAHRLPSAAGRLMAREVQVLSSIMERPQRPLVAILGGAKVSDKIGVVVRFLEIADVLCIGGAMCFPFLAAQGHTVGSSLCAETDLEPARRALALAADSRCRLKLPSDLVLAERADASAEATPLDGLDVPDGWIGLDIGPRTADRFAGEIPAAGTAFWNGPMGRFEHEPFAAGTRAVADALAEASATTVVGGGETVAALRRFEREGAVTHVSTGGGATLELLEGRTLPGLQALLAPAVAR